MKKIGLLTYHHTTNFGSMLQTYALYVAVEKMGYKCEVINYLNDAVEKREFVKRIRDCRSLKELKNVIKYGKVKRCKSGEMHKFFNSNMDISVGEYNRNSITKSCFDYDMILVGSDLVWDFTINNSDVTYMLDFVPDDMKKIAYASSVGNIWDDNEIDHVAFLLKRFDRIGVREKKIQEFVFNKMNLGVDFVCDPTMLLDSNEWKRMAGKRLIEGEYVVVYMADERQKIYEDATEYGSKYGMPVYVINYGWVDKKYTPIRPTKIEEFLSLIMYANTVFSASYHGLLFSLYFEKNVFYYNRGWKERMKSIATYLNIESREQWNCSREYHAICYENVNDKISCFRQDSLKLLNEYLAVCDKRDS